jgi:hypothetical protein
MKPDKKPEEKPAEQAKVVAQPDWPGAVARVRDTSTWIVKAFSGLGVLLVGSGPLLVRFNDLPQWSMAALGAAAAVVALVGVGLVIRAATRVMLPATVNLIELAHAPAGPLAAFRKHMEESPDGRALYLGDEDLTVEGLIRTQRSWRSTIATLSVLHEQAMALEKTGADPKGYPRDIRTADARAQLRGRLPAAKANLVALQQRVAGLLDQATYIEIRETYERAVPKMFRGAALVAAGTAVYLAAFGIDLGKAEEKAGAGSAAAAEAGVLEWAERSPVGARAVSEVRSALALDNAACNRIPVTATGKGSESDPWQVTTLEGGTCSADPTSFTIDSRHATVVRRTPTKYALTTSVRTENDPLELVAVGMVTLVAGAITGNLALRPGVRSARAVHDGTRAA